MHKYRTHNCNQLNKTNVGQEVKLSGFVHSKRDHGALIFIDLRDHFGITQLVVDSQKAGLNLDEIAAIKLESVITVIGSVEARAAEAVNANISTGEIEVRVATLHVESLAAQIPFQVNDNNEYPEELRLKYRFLDLRRDKTHKNIVLRSQVISEIRKVMTSPELDFLEIQTPILTASSPEGARDYLVPARLHPGKFYALPQAPQQFKQLLMVSGFNRYFQIAPCFRDEDLRADRAPEFYQLDMEMSFATQEDVFGVVEPVMKHIFNKFGVKKVAEESFPHITYEDAMLKYGIDKPDLRNPIIIAEATNVFVGSGFSIFTKAIDSGSIIRAIPAPKCAAQPRSFFDKMIEFAQSVGAKGLAYINFDENGEAKGPIAKFLSPEKLEELKKIANLQNGDAVFFACGAAREAAKIAGQVRIKLGHDLGLIDESVYKFCWIVDFPMYELSDEGKVDFSHNPFSMPQGGLEALNSQDPLTIKAFQYDVVCNGVELSSGAIRNHKPEIMYRAFELAGYGADVVEKEFGAMLNAFKYGAPPHGGIAPGIDRIIMLLADEPNIREVIPFPMNGRAQDLMMNAPAEVSLKQLRELHIDLKKKPNS